MLPLVEHIIQLVLTLEHQRDVGRPRRTERKVRRMAVESHQLQAVLRSVALGQPVAVAAASLATQVRRRVVHRVRRTRHRHRVGALRRAFVEARTVARIGKGAQTGAEERTGLEGVTVRIDGIRCAGAAAVRAVRRGRRADRRRNGRLVGFQARDNRRTVWGALQTGGRAQERLGIEYVACARSHNRPRFAGRLTVAAGCLWV